MMKKKEILEMLDNAGVYGDKLVAHKDGSFSFKKAFFYTHGNSSVKIAESIKEVLDVEIIETIDDWKNWPKTSYFVVKFRLA